MTYFNMIENYRNRVHVYKPVCSCTQTRMRARPHTLLTNRYMTPFDPPKISVARVSHFHVNSHISCKYINSLCIYFHLHSHFHMTLFALNDLNGSCLKGHGLLCPSLLKPSACFRWLSQSDAMKKVLPLKQSSRGQNLIVCSFINSYIHPFTATLVSKSPSHRVPHNIKFMIQHTVRCSC